MATDNEKIMEGFKQMAKELARMDASSKNVADNFEDLFGQIKAQNKGFTDFVLSGINLGPKLAEASRSLVTPMSQLRVEMIATQTGYKQTMSLLKDLRAARAMLAPGSAQRKQVEDAIKDENRQRRHWLAGEAFLREQHSLKKSMSKFTGEQLAIESLVIMGFTTALHRSRELNISLIDANSVLEERYNLNDKVWRVMSKTGHAYAGMVEAAKSLTASGFDLRDSFESTLEVMVQMKDGLGVSYDNSANLARIFEMNLKTPVREVANHIAAIKNQTGLAADEATRFATEIGKALYLIGPGGFQGNAQKVTGYIGMMAGRMKDVGGDAEDVVKLFNEMTKGTSEGFKLRGMTGVGPAGGLKTDAGAQAAMAGINRFIRDVVTAAGGTNEYSAQLEVAAKILGTTTGAVARWNEMIVASQKPLTEGETLQKAWREQMTVANSSMSQIKESLIGLAQRAFTPLLESITPLLQTTAKWVQYLASNEVVVATTMTALLIGIGVAMYSFSKLTISLYQAAAAAAVAAKFNKPTIDPFGLPGMGGNKGPGGLNKTMWNLANKLGALVPKIGSFGPTALVLAAGAAGAGVGFIMDKYWSSNPLSALAKKIATAIWETNNKSTVSGKPTGTSYKTTEISAVLQEQRRLMYLNKPEQLANYLKNVLPTMAKYKTPEERATFQAMWNKSAAYARERIAMASVTPDSADTRENDKMWIDALKEISTNIINNQEVIKKVDEKQADRDNRWRKSTLLRSQIESRLTPDPNSSYKPEETGRWR